jgi:hypothetical protein
MGRTQERMYSEHGRTGCVKQVVSRATGQPVSLYHAEQAGISTSDPWVTVCETHGTMAGYRSLRIANSHLPTGDWCEACMQTPSPEPAPVPAKTAPHRRPGAGRRPNRLISVTGGSDIRMSKDHYDRMGRPEWIAVAWNGHDVILRPAGRPEKIGQGIYKVEARSAAGGGINPAAFLAEHDIPNGRYTPTFKGTTLIFTPTRDEEAGHQGAA